jgi:hypothetical protein
MWKMQSFLTLKYEECKIPTDLDEQNVNEAILLERSKVLVIIWSRVSLKRYNLRDDDEIAGCSGFINLPGLVCSNLLKLSETTFCLAIRIREKTSKAHDVLKDGLLLLVINHAFNIIKRIQLPQYEEYKGFGTTKVRASLRKKSETLYKLDDDCVGYTQLSSYFLVNLKSQRFIHLYLRKLQRRHRMKHKITPISSSLLIARYSTKTSDVIEIRDIRHPSRAQRIIYSSAEPLVVESMIDSEFESQRYMKSAILALRIDSFKVCLLNHITKKILKTHRSEIKTQQFTFMNKGAIIISEDKTHILTINLYTGMQQRINYTLDTSSFIKGTLDTIFHIKRSSTFERSIVLINCSKLRTVIKTCKISKSPTPYLLYPNSEYGLVALWLDNGMLQVYKLKSNILIVSQKIGEDGSELSFLKFLKENLLLLVVNELTVLILRIEEESQEPSIYLRFRLTFPILSEAVYFYEERSLLIAVSHQLCLEAYHVFPKLMTAWLLVKDILSQWYPLDKTYKLSPCYLDQSREYLCFHAELVVRWATLIDIEELVHGKFREIMIGPLKTGGRLGYFGKKSLIFSDLWSSLSL